MNTYFMQKPRLFAASLGVVALTLLPSCQDEDFGYTAQEIAYQSNFTKLYGEIPEDRSWDLSSAANWSDPTINPEHTRLEYGGPTNGDSQLKYGTHFEYKDYWKVPNGLLDWMTKKLVEGNDNRYLGSSFVLELPENDFAIIPIFQGASAIMSELEVKVNGYQTSKVWTKSQNIKADDGKGKGLQHLGYFEGWANYDKCTDEEAFGTYQYHAASTIGAVEVQSKPIVFKKNAINEGTTYMYLSLHNIGKLPIPQGATGHDDNGKWVVDTWQHNSDGTVKTNMWDSNNVWTTVGDRITSIHSKGYMLALNVPWSNRPSSSELPNIVEGKTPSQVMIVGCEDANGTDSDHDVNDIVFLIVGYPNVPKIKATTEVIQKRYMCEDLGATDDFDFNDVVVDVTQTKKYQIMPSDQTDSFFNTGNEVSSASGLYITGMTEVPGSTVQTAKVSHVCGTLPIQVQVGDYLFPWITDPTDLDKTRKELMGGGWTKKSGSWQAISRQETLPTRAEYEVREEGWNPNEERVISGWVPNENNIAVYVQWPDNWPKPHDEKNHPITSDKMAGSNPYIGNDKKDFLDLVQGERHIESVTFPDNGRVPYIIAIDPDVHWMKERKNILVDWLKTGTFDKTHEDVAGVGSGAYYEDYNQSGERAIIWTGTVSGEKYSTGITFELGSAEHNGIVEALSEPFNYNTINIYTEKLPNDAVGIVGLGRLNNEWQLLSSKDADGYYADANVTNTKGEELHCVTIRLTDEQIANMKQYGFLLTSRTDALVIREINLCHTNSYYDVWLKEPALQGGNVTGSIRASDRERLRDVGEEGRLIPYQYARYRQEEPVTLTAVAAAGYNFVKWSDGATDISRTVNSNLGTESTPITAVFELNIPETTVSITNEHFHRWSTNYSSAYICNNAPWAGWVESGKGIGDGNVNGDIYCDLTNSEVLVIKNKGKDLRLLFNRESMDNTGDYYLINTASSDKEHVTKVQKNDETIFVVDIAGIRASKGYVHLNAIKGLYGENPEITSILVDKLDCPGHADWDYNNSLTASYAVTSNMFHGWNSKIGTNATISNNTPSDVTWNIGSNADGWMLGKIIGAPAMDYYVDLSSSNYMIVDVPKNVQSNPKFLFVDKNGEELGITTSNTKYVYVIKQNASDANPLPQKIIINLAAIKNDVGFVHLYAIVAEGFFDNLSTQITSIKVDDYYCAAEHGLPRELWSNSEIPVIVESWSSGSKSIDIPSNHFFALDTHQSTKLRIYVDRNNSGNQNFAMQVRTGSGYGITPIVTDNYYGASITSGGYIDIDMDNEFFDQLKSSQKLQFSGDNLKVTKVSLVSRNDDGYNLLLDNINSEWGAQHSRGPLKINFTRSEYGYGCGWYNISSDILNKYNSVKVKISKVTDKANTPNELEKTKVKVVAHADNGGYPQAYADSNGNINLNITNDQKQIYISVDEDCIVYVESVYLVKK